jgi:hypothetical protein
VLGTLAGTQVLRRMNAARFRFVAELLLAAIGIWFLVRR